MTKRFGITHLIALLSLTFNIVTPHITIQTAKLTPAQPFDNGVRIMNNIREVTNNVYSTGLWNVDMLYENTWQFIITIPPSFGFDISIKVDIQSSNTQALVFGFTTDNKQFISASIPMDKTGRPNQIYPACDQSIHSTQPLGIGDIASLPSRDRSCDIAGGKYPTGLNGKCTSYWKNMLPVNTGFIIESPITLTFENDPISNQLYFYFDSPSLFAFAQKCKFNSRFVPTNNGIKIYVAGDAPGQSYSIRSFELTSITKIPTIEPTKSPTINPTKSPSNNPSITPTKSPSIDPTISPTRNPTTNPSKNPSITPTNNPTNLPTKYPTNIPTRYPTKYPTKLPSISPTKIPTITPSNYPTKTPSNFPTNIPTYNPSNIPTITPTNVPTIRPSNNPSITPTFSPSNNPTLHPTKYPTNNPTNYPTNKPSNRPTNYPTINPSNIPTNNPSLKPSNLPTISPTYNPSFKPTNSPTLKPTIPPTLKPTKSPSNNPTAFTKTPTYAPTGSPVPPGFAWGAYNQLCQQGPRQTNALCLLPSDILLQNPSNSIKCTQPFDCCMCNSIECGINDPTNNPCKELRILGDYGAYGVQNIRVSGDPFTSDGISVDCQGVEACTNTNIEAFHVNFIDCSGTLACANSSITVMHPKHGFMLECAGPRACEGLHIDIIFPPWERACPQQLNDFEFTKIMCHNANSCEGLDITIKNEGCNRVIIQDFECTQSDSCNNAYFNLIGDVSIDNCNCGSSCRNTQGLESCFTNLYDYVCGDPYSCKLQTKTITNPRNGFDFICSSLESCKSSKFIIDINNNNPTKLEQVDYIGSFILGGDYSAFETTFIFENTQGNVIPLRRIQCSGKGSCDGTTFILGANIFVEEVVCAADSCINCHIKQTESSPGVPCDPKQISSILQI